MALELTVSLPAGGTVTARAYEPAAPDLDAALILAHGAGAGQESPFMIAFASALAGLGIDTITFIFRTPNSGAKCPTAGRFWKGVTWP